MGFVLSLLFIFVIVPITVAMLFAWFTTKKKIYVKIIVGVWAPLFALILVSVTIKFFTTKKVLKKADYYGSYTIQV